MSNIDQGRTLLTDGDKILVKGISCTDIIILFLLVRPLICCSPASSKRPQNWRHLARCLQVSSPRTSPKHILQFIRRHDYMIIPQSNPPTEERGAMRPSKRAIYSGKCPFKMEVKYFVDTVPRFLSNASCSGCDFRCKPIPYTLKLLRKKCENYWLGEEHEVRVAYVLEL